jgi:hypothetical protein
VGGARREPEPLHKTRKRKKKRNSGLSASRHRPPPPTTNKEGREEEEEESHVKGGRGFELAASESQESCDGHKRRSRVENKGRRSAWETLKSAQPFARLVFKPGWQRRWWWWWEELSQTQSRFVVHDPTSRVKRGKKK